MHSHPADMFPSFQTEKAEQLDAELITTRRSAHDLREQLRQTSSQLLIQVKANEDAKHALQSANQLFNAKASSLKARCDYVSFRIRHTIDVLMQNFHENFRCNSIRRPRFLKTKSFPSRMHLTMYTRMCFHSVGSQFI